MLILGLGTTLRVNVLVRLQFPEVPVTVYIVVTDGVTMMEEVNGPDGCHV